MLICYPILSSMCVALNLYPLALLSTCRIKPFKPSVVVASARQWGSWVVYHACQELSAVAAAQQS